MVSIDGLLLRGVMPMMEARSRDEFFQGTEWNACVGMDEDRLASDPDDAGVDCRLGEAQQIDRHNDGRGAKRTSAKCVREPESQSMRAGQ